MSERATGGIPAHEYFDRLCALVAAHEASTEEERQLFLHLQECGACRSALLDYKHTIAQAFTEVTVAEQGAELAIGEHARAKDKLLSASGKLVTSPRTPSFEMPTAAPFWSRLPAWPAYAAAAILLVIAGWSTWRRPLMQSGGDASPAVVRLQGEIRDYRERIASTAAQRDAAVAATITEKKNKEAEAARAEELKRSLSALQTDQRQRELLGAEFQNQLRSLKASLDVLQASEATTEKEKADLAQRVSDLTNDLHRAQADLVAANLRSEELSRLSTMQLKHAEQQGKLLATDEAITDVLGARSLHIIDVFDISKAGQFEHPFGRIFYTEGKSLIFYAFDLDKQKGLKRGSVFLAWGQRREDKGKPFSLGAFYIDDPTQNRWILRVDNARTLSQIDCVFVTDSSHKDSTSPRGSPLLFAFLSGKANHP